MSENDHQANAQAQTTRRRRGCLLWAGIVAVVIVLSVCALVGVLWTSGARAKAELAEQYPPPGQLVDVGGYQLHVHCQGKGSSTVVIEAGMGEVFVGWSPVQREVAKFT